MPTETKLDSFTQAYIEAALWSSTGEPFGTCAKCGEDDKVLYWSVASRKHELCYACSEDDRGHSPYEPPLDANYGIDDLAPETLEKIIADCQKFQDENRLSLSVFQAAREHGEWSGEELTGHDFWLTRAGHGTGFWDRFHARSKALIDIDRDNPEEREEAILARLGDRLTRASKAFGECNLYVGDDGRIYV